MEMLVIQFSCIDLGVDVWIRQIKHDQLIVVYAAHNENEVVG